MPTVREGRPACRPFSCDTGGRFDMPGDRAATVRIDRWSEWQGDGAEAELDRIFFEASATKSFASDEDRARFRHRWLGRYLEHYPAFAYVAVMPEDRVGGYLVGSLDDPAKTPLFSDLGYFQPLAALTACYPAQLHVNLAPEFRSQGIGGALVDRFCADAARAGAAGAHAVTSRGMRNVGFYERQGFTEKGAVAWNGRELVLLGRDLSPQSGR